MHQPRNFTLSAMRPHYPRDKHTCHTESRTASRRSNGDHRLVERNADTRTQMFIRRSTKYRWSNARTLRINRHYCSPPTVHPIILRNREVDAKSNVRDHIVFRESFLVVIASHVALYPRSSTTSDHCSSVDR